MRLVPVLLGAVTGVPPKDRPGPIATIDLVLSRTPGGDPLVRIRAKALHRNEDTLLQFRVLSRVESNLSVRSIKQLHRQPQLLDH
jgi:hypothetical protein